MPRRAPGGNVAGVRSLRTKWLAAGAVVCSAFAVPVASGSPSPVVKNAISVDVPATVKAGRPFLAEADAQLDKRLHKPPYDYLKAALFSARGTTACPLSVPTSARVWDTVATYDYGQSRSVNVTFGTTLTLRPGRHRFCAYVYVSSPSRKIGSFGETLHTKARASKLVRARTR